MKTYAGIPEDQFREALREYALERLALEQERFIVSEIMGAELEWQRTLQRSKERGSQMSDNLSAEEIAAALPIRRDTI